MGEGEGEAALEVGVGHCVLGAGGIEDFENDFEEGEEGGF